MHPAPARSTPVFKLAQSVILTLRARKRTEILGSTSRLARWCHHQRVEVGLSPSVNSGVPRRIYFNSCLP